MIITCQDCNTSFNLDENLLKPSGSKVRCSQCGSVFVQSPPSSTDEDAGLIADAIPAFEEETVPEFPKHEAGETDEDVLEDLGLDMDIEAEERKEAVSDAEPETDESEELDLSGLEDLLEAEEPEIDEVSETDVLDDLDLEPEAEEIEEDSMEDLELDFDMDLEPEKTGEAVPEAGAEESEELDLSGLGDLLEAEESEADEGPAENTMDDLDLDLDLELEEDTTGTKTEPDIEESEELDLSEIEDMLDTDVSDTEESIESEELELEFDMDDGTETKDDTVDLKPDESGEMDIAEISELEDILDVAESESESEEMVLELDIEEEAPEEEGIDLEFEDAGEEDFIEIESMEEEPEEDKFGEVTDPFYMETQVLDLPEEETKAPAVEAKEEIIEPAAVKKGGGKSRLILLIAGLILVAAGGIYTAVGVMGVKIPFISDYFKTEIPDPSGSLKINTFGITSKFVDNVKAGKLFVITGRARNDYPDIRNFIQISGKLFKKGKKLNQTKTAFCGNVLSEIELANLDPAAIKKRLSNRIGQHKSNMKIAPGKSVPFMVVFSNLPPDLDEFTIEVLGSMGG